MSHRIVVLLVFNDLVINMRVFCLLLSSEAEAKGAGEHNRENNTALLNQLAQDTVKISNSYAGAIGMLQNESHARRESASEVNSGIGVVLNACTLHLEDMTQHATPWGHDKTDDFDMDRYRC